VSGPRIISCSSYSAPDLIKSPRRRPARPSFDLRDNTNTCGAKSPRLGGYLPKARPSIEFRLTLKLWTLPTMGRGVCWGFEKMRPRKPRSNAPGNKWHACVCLLAVILLWAPAWASAFQAQSMACCEGGMCPLRGHAPKKSSHDTDGQKQAQPATCEHHGRSSGMSCSMACCHPSDPTVTSTAIFVLPGPMQIYSPFLSGTAERRIESRAESFVYDPASPPPRS